mgnify:CR=1 FL=1
MLRAHPSPFHVGTRKRNLGTEVTAAPGDAAPFSVADAGGATPLAGGGDEGGGTSRAMDVLPRDMTGGGVRDGPGPFAPSTTLTLTGVLGLNSFGLMEALKRSEGTTVGVTPIRGVLTGSHSAFPTVLDVDLTGAGASRDAAKPATVLGRRTPARGVPAPSELDLTVRLGVAERVVVESPAGTSGGTACARGRRVTPAEALRTGRWPLEVTAGVEGGCKAPVRRALKIIFRSYWQVSKSCSKYFSTSDASNERRAASSRTSLVRHAATTRSRCRFSISARPSRARCLR